MESERKGQIWGAEGLYFCLSHFLLSDLKREGKSAISLELGEEERGGGRE